MRMPMRRATHLALMLLMAAGPGVAFGSPQAQAPAKKKPSSPSAKSGGTSHRRSTKASSKSRRDHGQKAPTPERITEIQQALAKDGSFNATPTGKWDDATVDAVKRFQEANGLNPNGKLDAKTLQKLGLGSSVSGVAAPMPSANSVSANVPAPPTAKQQ